MTVNKYCIMAVKTRIKYFDALKFLAITGVVFLHCFILKDAEILNFNIHHLSQIGRFGVPLFLLISGALLLNREIELKSFFKKRFVRICYPLLFFIVFAYIFNIYKHPLVAFWYCWMVLGAYLAIPVINVFVKFGTEKEIEYFLGLFAVTAILYQIFNIFDITYSLDLNFFITPISYLVLGYYLSTKEFKRTPNQMILISLALFIVSTILKMKFGNFFDIYPKMNLSSTLDFGILQIIQVSSVFLMVKNIYSEQATGIFSAIKGFLEGKIVNGFILSVSRASYGMYLVHMLFLKLYIRPFFKTLELSGPKMFIACSATFVSLFLVSWIITVILGKIPYINKISGYA